MVLATPRTGSPAPLRLARRRPGRLARALGAATLVTAVAACSTPTATPVPSAAAPSPTWNARVAEMDSLQAVWDAQQPPAYAYTLTHTIDGVAGGGAAHVTHIDGRTEALQLTPGTYAGPPLTVEGVFDTARQVLGAGNGTTTYEANQQYGYLVSLRHESTSADGSFGDEVTDFATPGDRTAAERARAALEALLTRWGEYASPAWEYTWSRYTATDTPASATTWTVRHADGETVGVRPDGTTGAVPDEATIGGTAAAAAQVLAGGGWVDVATDQSTGLTALLAVDPSPSTTGDGYWIRVTVTDLANRAARKALAAAQDRWAAAKLAKYAYTWTFDGGDRTWRYTVSMKGDRASIKASAGTPTGEAAPIAPRIAELLAAIESTLGQGGTVTATYDRKLGYPVKVVVPPGAPDLPAGTYTITGFKRG